MTGAVIGAVGAELLRSRFWESRACPWHRSPAANLSRIRLAKFGGRRAEITQEMVQEVMLQHLSGNCCNLAVRRPVLRSEIRQALLEDLSATPKRAARAFCFSIEIVRVGALPGDAKFKHSKPRRVEALSELRASLPPRHTHTYTRGANKSTPPPPHPRFLERVCRSTCRGDAPHTWAMWQPDVATPPMRPRLMEDRKEGGPMRCDCGSVLRPTSGEDPQEVDEEGGGRKHEHKVRSGVAPKSCCRIPELGVIRASKPGPPRTTSGFVAHHEAPAAPTLSFKSEPREANSGHMFERPTPWNSAQETPAHTPGCELSPGSIHPTNLGNSAQAATCGDLRHTGGAAK